MRNLFIANFTESVTRDGLPLTATAWSTHDDSVICAFGPTPNEPIIRLERRYDSLDAGRAHESTNRSVGIDTITSWDAPCPLPELDCDEILLMHHFPDSATTCLVLAGGDLVLVREQPGQDQEPVEIVGSIDVGIAAAAWAPDEEVLAIVTRADNLVLMSRMLEPLNEISMSTDDLNASKHVSVGWGKKETQFQGKRAKAMRDPTMPEHVDEGKLSPFEDNAISISWRGDGAYFAISSVILDVRRLIRVYSREGILDSVSEPVDGLEAALSWRPAGNLIASLKRSLNALDLDRLEVVFFERNGLRHGEFDLRVESSRAVLQAKKVKMQWNVDSTVLAISYLDSVQLWTMSNYHYYLKQDISVTSGTVTSGVQHRPVSVTWHPRKPLKCSLQSSEKLVKLSCELQVCRGITTAPSDSGTVAVIDGRCLKITPLRQAGVPPPMSFCELQNDANIADCAISRNGQLVATIDQYELNIWKWKRRSESQQSSKLMQHFTTNFESLIKRKVCDIFNCQLQCLKLCFQADTYLYILSPGQNEMTAQCYRLDLEAPYSQASSITVPNDAQILQSDVSQNTVWVSDGRGTTLVGSETGPYSPNSIRFDVSCSSFAIFRHKVQPTSLGAAEPIPEFSKVKLMPGNTLLVDGRVVARDCTSFVVTDAHLIFTTGQHLLKFIHLTLPDSMEIPGDIPEADERCRAIEREARIVTVIPSIYAVVLQMPRGNLETIYPRVLVVNGIRNSLERCEYRAAFAACQVHQVDMNILYDHLPIKFLDNIPKFIDDLSKPSRIDEFLSKLKDEDVTETLYKDTLKASERKDSLNDAKKEVVSSNTIRATLSNHKVNRICDSFIAVLNTRGSKHLTNVITAHVCKRPPDLSAGLMLVSSLKKNSPDEADLAVSHLCFLTDTNRLYDAALGLYDLDLALLVAQNAQRDPREYMPFLQSLHLLPALRRQYQIDNHLKQYKKALISLHSLKVHTEVEAYTIRHGLYTAAIDLYKYDSENLPKMTILYAEHLESLSNYASAAILRESLGQYNLAYPLYALAHLWRESLTCATLVPVEHTKLIDLATSLATTCSEESRDYRSAAAIYVDYLHDIPGAARLLCKGSYFADATRLMALHNLSGDISTIIDPGLTEKFGEIVELVADCKTQLAAQVPRIIELRKKKEEDPLAFYGGDADAMAADGVDIPDNISLAPTDATTVGGQSLFTRYGSNASKFGGTVASNVSRKTSKTKRREERKRARGKKGSVYEEEYLIGSVGRLIERINGVQDEVKRLISGMLRRGLKDQSCKVEEIMQEMCVLCEKARVEVWQIHDEGRPQDESSTSVNVDGQMRPSGPDGVFWDSQQQITAPNKSQAPTVKKWSQNLLTVR